MRDRDRRAKPPTEPLGAGFLMDREVDSWDVALAGIVSASGSLDDPVKAWEGVNRLRSHGNPLPLTIWWAAAAWPDRVECLILPPPLADPPQLGTVATHAVACLAAAGLMDFGPASEYQRWRSPLAGFAADTAATAVTHGTGQLLMATAGQQLEDMALKLGHLNTAVRVGEDPPEFSEAYLLAVAGVAESLRYVSAGLARALDHVVASLGGDTRAFDTPPTAHDVPADLRTIVSAEIHLGFVQAATKINLTGE